VDRDAAARTIRGEDGIEVGACGVRATVAVRPFASRNKVYHGVSSEAFVRDCRARSGIRVGLLQVHLDGYSIGQRVSRAIVHFCMHCKCMATQLPSVSSGMPCGLCGVTAPQIPDTASPDQYDSVSLVS